MPPTQTDSRPLNALDHFERDPHDGNYYRKRDDALALWLEGPSPNVDDAVYESCTQEERLELELLTWTLMGGLMILTDWTDGLKLRPPRPRWDYAQ